jgi:glycosyltransferase involved in cell wall biosynthesis
MGIENLIEAFKNSPDLRRNSLLYIGGKGPLENRLKSLVQKYSLEETIRFTGRIPDNDLPICYRAADYFVLPTQELEGCGLVIPEAMACGTPVIGTPAGAIPEIIGAFDPRLLTKGTSSEDLKSRLEEIIKNRQDYRFTAPKCRKFVEENYSWKKMANNFQKTALKIIKNS